MMKQYYKFFRENNLLTKQDIIYSIDKYIQHCKGSNEEEWSRIKEENIIQLCYQFKSIIEKTKIPDILNKWYFYDYNFESDGIKLELCYCEDIDYDEYGYESDMDYSVVFELIKIECDYLSIDEFAEMFGVKPKTVKNWIKRGKIRNAKLHKENWIIPRIADRPKRSFENVIYYFLDDVEIRYNEFIFPENCKSIYICKDDANREMFNVILKTVENKRIKTLQITNLQREKLEFFLISSLQVKCVSLSECIKYNPSKRERDEVGRDTEVLIHKSEKEDSIKYNEELEYGTVIVTKGPHKGRIGYYDCEYDDCNKGIVYWGDMYLCRDHYELINYNYLSNQISTIALLNRIEELNKQIAQLRMDRTNYYLCTQLSSELLYANDVLTERYINITFLKKGKDMKVFISHSSDDLTYARCLATDIMENGYDVFLDDWSIDLGQNIINSINTGLDESDIFIPIISKHFLKSVFCLDEWTSFYMRFAKIKNESILPLIIDDSQIPSIMSAIKYFRSTDGDSNQSFLSKLLITLKRREKDKKQ